MFKYRRPTKLSISIFLQFLVLSNPSRTELSTILPQFVAKFIPTYQLISCVRTVHGQKPYCQKPY